MKRLFDNRLRTIMVRMTAGYASEPIYWVGFFIVPLFLFLLISNLMESGLPERLPAAIVDMDHTPLSRETTRTLDAMQMVDLTYAAEDYSDARNKMQTGEIYGFFVIPENFQQDLLAGRGPTITFYSNMTYFVPGTLLYKTFKTTAVYLKAGVVLEVARQLGMDTSQLTGVINPISVVTRPIGNPTVNYAIYLGNSFMPGVLQLMIMLMTAFTLGENIKYGRSVPLMRIADGSIVKVLTGILLPQTLIWLVMAIFMESWLFGWNGYPMHGSWLWITVSQLLFVLAAQGFAVFIFGVLPNLRLALSVSALTGILTFSIAAYSFPVQSMYSAVGIFSWIVPARYNFLIYVDQALNGIDIYYSRWWFAAYIIFIILPVTVLGRIKKSYLKPVYVP